MGRRVPATAALTPEADQHRPGDHRLRMDVRAADPGSGDRPVDATIPGVDRAALSGASRASCRRSRRGFASCSDFVDAIVARSRYVAAMAVDDDDDPVGPFMPEPAAAVPIVAVHLAGLSFSAEETNVTAAERMWM